jgi:hypothetical protein
MSYDLKNSKLWQLAERSEERKNKEIMKWENILAKFTREFKDLEREWRRRASNPEQQQLLFRDVIELQDKIFWAEKELEKAKKI